MARELEFIAGNEWLRNFSTLSVYSGEPNKQLLITIRQGDGKTSISVPRFYRRQFLQFTSSDYKYKNARFTTLEAAIREATMPIFLSELRKNFVTFVSFQQEREIESMSALHPYEADLLILLRSLKPRYASNISRIDRTDQIKFNLSGQVKFQQDPNAPLVVKEISGATYFRLFLGKACVGYLIPGFDSRRGYIYSLVNINPPHTYSLYQDNVFYLYDISPRLRASAGELMRAHEQIKADIQFAATGQTAIAQSPED